MSTLLDEQSLQIISCFLLQFYKFHILLRNNFCFYWQFMPREFQCFLCFFYRETTHFKHDSSWLYRTDIMIRCAFSFSHRYFRTFFGDWSIWENTNPDLSTTADVPSQDTTS